MELQTATVEEVIGGAEEKIFLCTHPPIVTLGRKSKPGDIAGWRGESISVSRGGQATYHGPSQLIVYPILNLAKPRPVEKSILGYLRALEKSFVLLLKEYSIEAEGKTMQKNATGTAEDATGVWVGSQKLVSLGIAVRKWVAYHGAALNLDFDREAFRGFNPCGFQPETMVSMEQLLQRKVNREELLDKFKGHIREQLFPGGE